jgi:hypothetical protein
MMLVDNCSSDCRKPALEFPVLLDISSGCVQDGAVFRDAEPRDLIKGVSHVISGRIGHWLRAMAIDPVVPPILAEHPLRGDEGLAAHISGLSGDLIHAEGDSL